MFVINFKVFKIYNFLEYIFINMNYLMIIFIIVFVIVKGF